MICELIALGCLVAHGDISKSKRLQKAWDANAIINELSDLHPDFYPVPASAVQEGTSVHFTELATSPLPKSELLKLYGECGNVLHRGNIRKLVSEGTPVQVHYPDISSRAQKLNDLLSIHTLTTLDGRHMFACLLRSSNNGSTEAILCRRNVDQPPS